MPINLATFPGTPDGVVRNVPQQEIPDSAAWLILDGFVNVPGLVTERAGLATEITNVATARAYGLCGAVNPQGLWIAAQLIRKDTGPTGAIVGFKNSTMDVTWPSTPGTGPSELFDSKDALGGGTLIGTASGLGPLPTQSALALWRGGAKVETADKTPTAPIALGATSFTLASGASTFSPGHFVFTAAGDKLVGVVKSISGETITLEQRAIVAVASGDVYGTPFRGLAPRVSKGRITMSTDSPTVNGGGTTFRKGAMNSGTWDIFTTDLVYVGTVATVSSDAQLELTGNAAVAGLNADFIAIKNGVSMSVAAPPHGFIHASHAGHQFYALGNTVAFSDDDDPEALDLVDDTLTFGDANIVAMVPTATALVVLTETEAWALSGAIGTTPDKWRGDKIHTDGACCTMTAVAHKGGVIWEGRRGIWYWNGADPVNIAANLGDTWRRMYEGIGTTAQCWGAVINDHYMLHVESLSQTDIKTFGTSNYAEGTALTRFTMTVNLDTGAVTFLTNVGIRGWISPPPAAIVGDSYFSITSVNGDFTVRTARVFKGSELFAASNATGIDTYTCLGNAGPGPTFVLETKKYDLGTPQLLKLFKMLLLHFRLTGSEFTQAKIDAETADHLRFATVPGLDTAGTLSGKKLYVKAGVSAGAWQDKRVKFMKRSQYLSLRMWKGTTTITRLSLGAWALGFKQKRAGRV